MRKCAVTLVHALDPVDEFLVDNQLVDGLIAFEDIAVLYGAATRLARVFSPLIWL